MIGIVEAVKAREFLVVEAVETDAGLFVGRIRGEVAGARRFSREIGVVPDERQRTSAGAARTAATIVSCRSASVAKGRRALAAFATQGECS
jgi:hypothetical protein